MNRTSLFWVFVVIAALTCAGCSSDNSSSGDNAPDAMKPPPQVRVEAMPSATATLALPTEEVTATPEATATAAQVFLWPTPNEDEIMYEIDSIMDEMEKKLNSENFILNP